MTRYAFLLAAVSALALLAAGNPGYAAEQGTARMETTAASGRPKAHRYHKRRQPLQVDIYARRRPGGYSYGSAEVPSTYFGFGGRRPPPYAHVRQTPSGPFDSGFFFDSGVGDIGMGSRGGDSPYLH
ncbi:MAG TPA: hypothetical protein VFR19_22230 [Hyphomicrobiaceae bacterium]|nr:hypothetical protein [Hyphomicrobiaceae bacterium]